MPLYLAARDSSNEAAARHVCHEGPIGTEGTSHSIRALGARFRAKVFSIQHMLLLQLI